jgi:putative ABC transport system permease protein
MKLLRKLRSLFRKDQLDAEMSEEMRLHVELQTEVNRKAGMNPEEARYAALRQFGNVASIQEQAREGRGWVWLEQAGKDAGVAVRRLKRSPSFFLTVVAILAVCLGGNLTIFAWVDAILLRSLPFPEAEKLALVFNSYPQAGVMRDGSSVTNYYERRGQLPAFAGLALYRPSAAIVGDPNATQREAVIRVTPGFFEVLGRGPALGR